MHSGASILRKYGPRPLLVMFGVIFIAFIIFCMYALWKNRRDKKRLNQCFPEYLRNRNANAETRPSSCRFQNFQKATIDGNPANLPLPPKYNECMAPPSYEEVIEVQHPTTTDMAQSENKNNVTYQ